MEEKILVFCNQCQMACTFNAGMLVICAGITDSFEGSGAYSMGEELIQGGAYWRITVVLQIAAAQASTHCYSLRNRQWLDNPKLKVDLSMMIGSGEEGEAQMKSIFEKALQLMKTTFPEYFDTAMIDRLERNTDPKLYFKYAFTVGDRRRRRRRVVVVSAVSVVVVDAPARERLQAHEDLKMPPVLVQGDFWAHNVVVRKGDDGDDRLLAIIDWQARRS